MPLAKLPPFRTDLLAASLLTALALPAYGEDSSSSASLTSGTAFNPQISLILSGQFRHDNVNGAADARAASAEGVMRTGQANTAEAEGSSNGMQLGESELVLSTTIDPYLEGAATISLGENEVAVEEAWFQTRRLPAGLTLRAGRMLSGIGYLNGQHAHAQDFSVTPLPYASLLGAEGLADTGIRLIWLPLLPIYTQIGVELLQGDQEVFGTRVDAETQQDTTGTTAPVKERSGPRLTTAWINISPDIGDKQALQLGLWAAHNRQHTELFNNDETTASGDEYLLDGHARLQGLDVVWKYDAGAERGRGNAKVQFEYLRSDKALNTEWAGSSAVLAKGDNVQGHESGFYLQAGYGVAPRWWLAWRRELSGDSSSLTANVGRDPGTSSRSALSLAFLPSEFSRLRLETSRTQLADDDHGNVINTVVLQYTHSLGAHGAHSF